MLDGMTAAINRHLDEILASPVFVRSRRLGDFLRWIVDRSLSGEEAAINERGIAIAVYRRAEDFDSKTDGIVRAEAMRLRHKLREFYATRPAGPRIEIAKGGYIPAFVGFDAAPNAGEAAFPVRRRFLAAGALISAAFLLCAGAGWSLFAHRGAGTAPRLEASRLMNEAGKMIALGDNTPALALLDRAITLDGGSPPVHLARADVLESLGRKSEARVEALRARELSGEGPEALAVQARLHSLDGDWAGAIERVRAMLAHEPESPDLLRQLAVLELQNPGPPGWAAARDAIARARRLPGAETNPELDRIEAWTLGSQGAVTGDPTSTRAAILVALRGEEKAAALHADSAMGRLVLLESGLRFNAADPQGLATLMRTRALCESVHDKGCIARTFRIEGNVDVSNMRYREALEAYRRALPLARKWENWQEVDNLFDGIDAAISGLSPLRADNRLRLFPAHEWDFGRSNGR